MQEYTSIVSFSPHKHFSIKEAHCTMIYQPFLANRDLGFVGQFAHHQHKLVIVSQPSTPMYSLELEVELFVQT